MTSVSQHYAGFLAPIYVWMAGGLEHAFALGASDVSEFLGSARYAVDLGAGFGMHTIPLARAGTSVLAVDTSQELLSHLALCSPGQAVQMVQADLLDFPSHLRDSPDLILCMGDTLTHLPTQSHVEQLIRAVAASLRPGGTFLATFRDYRTLPTGDNRFIPVRSDDCRIHTCYLEELPEHVLVHDIVHERDGDHWRMRVSSYQKCRLYPGAIVAMATDLGLTCSVEPGPRGMLKLRADA
ncbi:class I SAM-dependent methyltransferase [Acidovorax sp.]|uniref:class I SAM-dependent methyltransferase n=1 Tax=Acidovorax sp. TaxID=1872122 RepID=UPI0026318EF6|nr:class I SAM-dependent methyltransferase [Acidovorax sp.]